jgi:hypothetical protein
VAKTSLGPFARRSSRILVCIAAAACGRIGYLPEDIATEATAPGGWVDATGSGGMDAAAGPAMDVMAETTTDGPLDGVADLADVIDESPYPDVDTSEASDATSSGSDGGLGDSQSTEGGAVDGEAGATFFVCDSSACCCAYACKYATVPSASTCSGASDTAQYGFESGTQGWVLSASGDALIPGQTTTTTTERFAGSSALQVTLSVPAGSMQYARYNAPAVAPLPGSAVTFHVWVAPGAGLLAIQPYVMDKNYLWSGSYVELGQLVPGCWATITLAVPASFVTPAFEIGVEFFSTTTAAYNGVAYVGAVEW